MIPTLRTQRYSDKTKCNLFLCKGMQLADNTANVQKYAPGQTIPITVNIVAPHSGSMNTSVVNLKTNSLIGGMLISVFPCRSAPCVADISITGC